MQYKGGSCLEKYVEGQIKFHKTVYSRLQAIYLEKLNGFVISSRKT
jgi:hypothetical protein